MVERNFFDSLAKAQAAIAAGLVKVDGRIVLKASEPVPTNALIEATPAHPYVSRGDLKLKAALEAFNIDARGAVCLDIGASTGGFCRVLLEAEASRVYAIDVGHSQLHPSIAESTRIINLEGVDARKINETMIPEKIDLLVSDVSFISLKLVLPPAMPFLKSGAHLAVLIKPQFEARPANVRKGLVKDKVLHQAVCNDLKRFVAELGFDIVDLIPSPITGGDGSREFLIGARHV